MMSIQEYVDCEDSELREDYEYHITCNVFDEIFYCLPGCQYSDDVLMWTDGQEILCKTQWLAETIADMIEHISGEYNEVTTGYYDPNEDERNGEVDKRTGWYYVDIG